MGACSSPGRRVPTKGASSATTSTGGVFAFSLDTKALADGSHWLYVRAYDGVGNYGTAGVTNVIVANGTPDTTPPSVAFVAPASGATVSGLVAISATATDDVGVSKVEFSVDGALKTTLSGAPWSFDLDMSGLSPGSHTLMAKAFDTAGNSSSSSIIVSIAEPADTSPPTVSIASPASGANVSETIQVQADAADNAGVTKVELSVDNSLKATLTAAPWSFDLDTAQLTNASHTLSVKAYDAAGNSSTAQVSVVVQNALADTTAPKAPSGAKAAVVGTTQVAIYWTPSTDNLGVAGYEVTRDGAVVASTRLPNYLDSGLTPGTSHVYSVRAYDDAGNRSLASSNLNVKTTALSTSSTGAVAGVVYDPLGRPVANVVVQLTGNGVSKSAKTGASGVYKFSSLPPGSYTLAITPPVSAAQVGASSTSGLTATITAGLTTVLVT